MLVSMTAVALLVFGGLFGVSGSGRIKEEVRKVDSFRGVEVSGGIDARVTLGGETSVKLEGDDNLLRRIKTEVKDGRLVAYVEGGGIRPTRPIRLTVVTPKLESVEASGGSSVVAEASPSSTFSAEASGGGSVDVKGLATDRLTVGASGGARVKLSGAAKSMTLDASGGVNVDADALSVDRAELDCSGGVDARLNVTGSLTGDLSGGVSVKVRGRPKVDVDASGGSAIRSVD